MENASNEEHSDSEDEQNVCLGSGLFYVILVAPLRSVLLPRLLDGKVGAQSEGRHTQAHVTRACRVQCQGQVRALLGD